MKRKTPTSQTLPAPPPRNPALDDTEEIASAMRLDIKEWLASCSPADRADPNHFKKLRDVAHVLAITHRIHFQNDRRNNPQWHKSPTPPRNPKDPMHDPQNILSDRVAASKRISRQIELLRQSAGTAPRDDSPSPRPEEPQKQHSKPSSSQSTPSSTSASTSAKSSYYPQRSNSNPEIQNPVIPNPQIQNPEISNSEISNFKSQFPSIPVNEVNRVPSPAPCSSISSIPSSPQPETSSLSFVHSPLSIASPQPETQNLFPLFLVICPLPIVHCLSLFNPDSLLNHLLHRPDFQGRTCRSIESCSDCEDLRITGTLYSNACFLHCGECPQKPRNQRCALYTTQPKPHRRSPSLYEANKHASSRAPKSFGKPRKTITPPSPQFSNSEISNFEITNSPLPPVPVRPCPSLSVPVSPC